MAEQAHTPEQVRDAFQSLTRVQRGFVARGCISGDFQMKTIRALKRKGIFHFVIDSPNGQCGFMHLTPLGEAVRAIHSRRHHSNHH